MSDKKLRERLFLNEIATIYLDFPSGVIADHERPDFLIQQDAEVIGIEIIDFVRGQGDDGSPQRRNEIIWQRVADSARIKYSANYSDPLFVNFFWYPRCYPSQSEVELLASSAAEIVANYRPQMLHEYIKINPKVLDGTPLEEYVRTLHITRASNNGQGFWSFVSGNGITLQISEIESLISSKDAKIEEYLQNCNKVWLIIVADGQRISSNADLSADVQQYSFSSRFQRILFYSRFEQQIVPLVVNGLK